ncbi:DUF4381 domain-containing protein [Halochromatium sp.]
MNPDLRPLRDIHDSLGNPWWPLAPGWWLLLALIVVIVALVWHYRRAGGFLPRLPLLQIGDWRWDARRQLQRLRRAPRHASVKARLAELSELLKRIAMARHGRSTCAGLHGQAWLDWLGAHDPEGFDWPERGQLLIHAPYAPDRIIESIGPPTPESAAGTSRDGNPRGTPRSIPGDNPEREIQDLMAATERWISAPLGTSRKDSKTRANAATAGQSGTGRLGKLVTALANRSKASRKPRTPPEAV